MLSDVIFTKALDFSLSLWTLREVEMVDSTHPWSLEKQHTFDIGGEMYPTTLAEVCLKKPDVIEQVLVQLPPHIPKGKVIVPLPSSLKKIDKRWKHDTYWTTGLSPKSSLLRLRSPGQNKLGEMMERIMLTAMMAQNCLRDHDYL